MNETSLLLFDVLSLVFLAIVAIRVLMLSRELEKLKAELKEHYWTKETIARTYGEAPLAKKEAEARQDRVLKGEP